MIATSKKTLQIFWLHNKEKQNTKTEKVLLRFLQTKTDMRFSQ